MRHIAAATFGLLALLMAGIWIEVMLRDGASLQRDFTAAQVWWCLLGAFLFLVAFSAASHGGKADD